MTAPRRPSRRLHALLIAGLVIGALGAIPTPPASAAVEVAFPIDDTATEFGDTGSQLFGSALVEETEEQPVSRKGGVQLSPVGTLDWRQTGNTLPEGRNGVAAASIGRFVFVIGGGSGTTLFPTVYRAEVNLTNGVISQWQTDTALPPVRHFQGNEANSLPVTFTQNHAARSSAAVATVVTNAANGDGLIYVIGGIIPTGPQAASRSVIVATVQGGQITGWREPCDSDGAGPLTACFLPAVYGGANNQGYGVAGASAFIANVASGRYLYVVGGRHAFPGSPPGARRVVYARVEANGDLTWQTAQGNANSYFDLAGAGGAPIPYNAVWDAALINGDVVNQSGELQHAFFIAGGQVATSEYTQRVVKGVVNPANGSLTFESSADVGNYGSLTRSYNGHGAVLWQNGIYVFGGRNGATAPNPSSDPAGAFSQISVNRTLSQYGVANFQDLLDSPQSAIPSRFGGGYTLVPSNRPGVAYVYYIGGSGSSVEGTEPGRVVSIATIGEPPATPQYAQDGWYFSAPVQVAFGGTEVRIRNVRWFTERLANGADVEVSYRTSRDADCQQLRTSNEAWTPPLDGNTISPGLSRLGDNAFELDVPQVRCFQYRARLVRGAGETDTPVMARMAITVEVPGSADLKFPANGVEPRFNSNGQLTDVTIRLRNENLFEPPTLNADYNGDNTSFALDLFIYPPGVTPNPPDPSSAPLSLTFPHDQYNRATIQVNKPRMAPNTTIEISLADTRWTWTRQDQSVVQGQPISLPEFFPQAGTYTIVAVVDGVPCGIAGTIGCVKETAAGYVEPATGQPNPLAAEQNNVSAPATASITVPPVTNPVNPNPEQPGAGREIYVPLIFRN